MQKLLRLRKATGGLKSAGQITVIFHGVGLGGGEMPPEVHCDGGSIITKGRCKGGILFSSLFAIMLMVVVGGKAKSSLIGPRIARTSGGPEG